MAVGEPGLVTGAIPELLKYTYPLYVQKITEGDSPTLQRMAMARVLNVIPGRKALIPIETLRVAQFKVLSTEGVTTLPAPQVEATGMKTPEWQLSFKELCLTASLSEFYIETAGSNDAAFRTAEGKALDDLAFRMADEKRRVMLGDGAARLALADGAMTGTSLPVRDPYGLAGEGTVKWPIRFLRPGIRVDIMTGLTTTVRGTRTIIRAASNTTVELDSNLALVAAGDAITYTGSYDNTTTFEPVGLQLAIGNTGTIYTQNRANEYYIQAIVDSSTTWSELVLIRALQTLERGEANVELFAAPGVFRKIQDALGTMTAVANVPFRRQQETDTLYGGPDKVVFAGKVITRDAWLPAKHLFALDRDAIVWVHTQRERFRGNPKENPAWPWYPDPQRTAKRYADLLYYPAGWVPKNARRTAKFDSITED